MYNLRTRPIQSIQAIETINNNLHNNGNSYQYRNNDNKNLKTNHNSKGITFDEILNNHIQNINKNKRKESVL